MEGGKEFLLGTLWQRKARNFSTKSHMQTQAQAHERPRSKKKKRTKRIKEQLLMDVVGVDEQGRTITRKKPPKKMAPDKHKKWELPPRWDSMLCSQLASSSPLTGLKLSQSAS